MVYNRLFLSDTLSQDSLYDRFYQIFTVRSRDIAMATNFMVKMGEIGRLIFIRRLGIPNGLEYRNSDFKRFIEDDLATSCKNLVNFGSVSPKFKRGIDVHRSSISSLATSA